MHLLIITGFAGVLKHVMVLKLNQKFDCRCAYIKVPVFAGAPFFVWCDCNVWFAQ